MGSTHPAWPPLLLILCHCVVESLAASWEAAFNPDNLRASAVNPKNTRHRIFDEEDDPVRNKGDPGQYFHDRFVDQHVRRAEHWRQLQTVRRAHLRGTGSLFALGAAEGGDDTEAHYGARELNAARLRAMLARCHEEGRRCDTLGVRRLGEGPGGETLPWGNSRSRHEL
eukprot:TRINITY_DN24266_c0_g1_i10.p4 TRINITY_DN24266_c0_g1~~TRINITY_DN24266_c0_g1_i10.p4  ORF type:complete len:169 (+),score=25.17 TRINITY_DN24266_c0_g1_i10:70-576(+)